MVLIDALLIKEKACIRPNMENLCHIWACARAPYTGCLDLLDRVQKRGDNIVDPQLASNLQSLSHRCKVGNLSLFYRYYHGKCSKEHATLAPPKWVTERDTRFSSGLHSYAVEVSLRKRNFYSDSFLHVLLYFATPFPLIVFLMVIIFHYLNLI